MKSTCVDFSQHLLIFGQQMLTQTIYCSIRYSKEKWFKWQIIIQQLGHFQDFEEKSGTWVANSTHSFCMQDLCQTKIWHEGHFRYDSLTIQ